MPPFNDMIVKQLPWVDGRGYSTPPGAQDGGAIQSAINFIGSLERRRLP